MGPLTSPLFMTCSFLTCVLCHVQKFLRKERPLNAYTLERFAYKKFGTFGRWFDSDGELMFWTVEREWNGNQKCISCVPEGRYKVEYEYSGKYKKKLPTLQNVPDRTLIRIHPANWGHQLKGCIALGCFVDVRQHRKTRRTLPCVWESSRALKVLLDEAPDSFELDIRYEPRTLVELNFLEQGPTTQARKNRLQPWLQDLSRSSITATAWRIPDPEPPTPQPEALDDAFQRLVEMWRKLSFVSWDRHVTEPHCITSYGWIAREDRHADFVVLNFPLLPGKDVTYTTSSEAFSVEIDRRIWGRKAPHEPCQRIENLVSADELPNCVRLEACDE